MDIRKKNIHMDYDKKNIVTQIAIEDDVNISDSKPDVSSIVFEKGDFYIEETRVSQDHVLVKGNLIFSVLYAASEGERALYSMSGSIPVEEMVSVEGVKPGDNVEIRDHLEDLTVMMINSRKISIRALVTLMLQVNVLMDLPIPIELEEAADAEYCSKLKKIWQMEVRKRDLFRVREEIEIPKNLPNIMDVIWEEIKPAWVDFRVAENKILIQGELSVFFLYEGEGEEGLLRYYENIHPFSGSIDCQNIAEGMIPVIRYRISSYDFSVKPDYDGESRIIAVDMSMELDIRIYEEENLNVISDLYGVSHDITAMTRKAVFRNLLSQNSMKQRLVERIRIPSDSMKIIQLLYSRPTIVLDETQITEEGIEVSGNVGVHILYISNHDETPYSVMRSDIPFSYVIDVPGITAECSVHVEPMVEQISVIMVNSEEVDVKMVLDFHATVFCNEEEELIDEIEETPLDMERMNSLPGIVLYIAGEGDSLWQIGRKYYVPVRTLKEMNHLSSDEIHKGDHILVVR